jgi:MFS transporter, ACS family, tartrate transporter
MMVRTIEQRTLRKVYWRLLPLALVAYFMCYLDRINVGFAALTMNKDIGLDAATYGMAAGVFFWGYFLFEVPSNMVLEKVGARLWIARIMVSWGILSGATAFVTGPWSFLTVRFLLGLAEAGLYPGIVLFFTYWFPDRHRGRIMAGFTLALPIAVAAGAPISTALLQLNGTLGLAGWKWMYLCEAVPTVLLGVLVLAFLTDRPAKAWWLDDAERAWLAAEMDRERRAIEAHDKIGVWRSFWDAKVLLMTLNYFGIVTASLGLLLFLPQMVQQLGFTTMQVGWVTMIPYTLGAVSMAVWGWLSDRMGERRWNLFFACSLATVGLAIAGMTIGTYWSIVGMSIAAIGLYGTKGAFWSMPPMILTGAAAATGIAWINSIGNLGGFIGPSAVGWAKQLTGSFSSGLYVLAGFALMSALVSALWLNVPRRVAIAEPARATAA